MYIEIGDQQLEVGEGENCGQILSRALSKKKLKTAVGCRCATALLDVHTPIDPTQCTRLEAVDMSSPEGLAMIRHSAAHIMAEAVQRLFPTAKVTIGPDIESGFYYDFDFERPFTPQDLEAIEAEMAKSVAEDQPFHRRNIAKKEAHSLFESMGETYKLEILNALEDGTVSLYEHGGFTDLCRGPHVPSTGYIKAFKLTSVAGAYWRGDESRPMLQRIYGTAFASQKDLQKYLLRLEEAKKRDHRKLGVQLDLFSFCEEAGPGMPIFHPKGAMLRFLLEHFERREHLRRGYQLVQGPQMLRRELWERSGHYDNYRENMYFTEIDEQAYGVKPMNCLAHMLIYKSQVRSYRDLPLRFFELGTVQRHEKSGVLHGLLRVRQFTQDDAHILCRPDQLQDEIIAILHLVQDVMSLFGFEYEVALSTRPDKSIGADADWERATTALTNALETLGLEYAVNPGDGAFYGPKIDIKLKDALDRRWQCSTIQCDFTLPERFDLYYTGQDGNRHRPVMLHRVILGALERFLGILIEHYAGAFPVWLAPVQARVLTVTDAQNPWAEDCVRHLQAEGFRVETDLRNEKLGYKVREAQLQKIPFMLVIGEREAQSQAVNVRTRTGENRGEQSLDQVTAMIRDECIEPFKRGGMPYYLG
ncbi:threonine--tRNA ligase [Desulfonatronum thioautotrophicum]|uniref:threonine--tRNA ligase n=1 Tax=Desulfonatronum thioautotrophicum TaxID=617001 RepID=UPI0005EB03AF|nr:threonine--tRNA ligase [Desulfonatronum thioautotrophicum]